MNREVIWEEAGGIGQEHLTVSVREGVIIADSFGIALMNSTPTRVRYQILCSADWAVRGVGISTEVAGASPTVIELRSDGTGAWTNSDGSAMPHLDGCIDVDLSSTPFTNTLPIRRLNLQPGQSDDITAAFIDVASLRIDPREQRYTGVAEGVVRYESLSSGFHRDLEVDEDGLVRNYPGLFTRIWSNQAG